VKTRTNSIDKCSAHITTSWISRADSQPEIGRNPRSDRPLRQSHWAPWRWLSGFATRGNRQDRKPNSTYSDRAPIGEYLTAERNAKITLARNAAPPSISRDEGILILWRHGYEYTLKGKNGFVCVVERSWMLNLDDPDFGQKMSSYKDPHDKHGRFSKRDKCDISRKASE
jgi:hypothetical protein